MRGDKSIWGGSEVLWIGKNGGEIKLEFWVLDLLFFAWHFGFFCNIILFESLPLVTFFLALLLRGDIVNIIIIVKPFILFLCYFSLPFDLWNSQTGTVLFDTFTFLRLVGFCARVRAGIGIR